MADNVKTPILKKYSNLKQLKIDAPLYMLVLLNVLGYGLIVPVLPDLILEVSGETLSQSSLFAGQLLFVYAACLFLMTPIFGVLSDRIGRRPILLLSLVGFTADYIIMAVANDLTVLFIGRLLSGIFAANAVAIKAYLSDQYSGEDLAVKFGNIGALTALGMILGPAIGGYLGLISVRAPFYFAATISFINLLLVWANLKEKRKPEKKDKIKWRDLNPLSLIPALIKKSSVRHLLISNLFVGIAYSAYTVIFSFSMITKFSWTSAEIGFSLVLFGLCSWLGQTFFVKYSVKRFGILKSIIIGLTSFAASLLCVGFATHAFWIYGAAIVSAITGVYGAAIYSKAGDSVSKDEQGRIYGLFASSRGLSMMIGPLLMSAIYFYFMESDITYMSDQIKAGTPFLFGAILTSLAMIIIILFDSKHGDTSQLEEG